MQVIIVNKSEINQNSIKLTSLASTIFLMKMFQTDLLKYILISESTYNQ